MKIPAPGRGSPCATIRAPSPGQSSCASPAPAAFSSLPDFPSDIVLGPNQTPSDGIQGRIPIWSAIAKFLVTSRDRAAPTRRLSNTNSPKDVHPRFECPWSSAFDPSAGHQRWFITAASGRLPGGRKRRRCRSDRAAGRCSPGYPMRRKEVEDAGWRASREPGCTDCIIHKQGGRTKWQVNFAHAGGNP
jgi:hypothetical protein